MSNSTAKHLRQNITKEEEKSVAVVRTDNPIEIVSDVRISLRKTSGNIANPHPSFIICNNCFWCASVLVQPLLMSRCPLCAINMLKEIPVSANEKFQINQDDKRGLTNEFSLDQIRSAAAAAIDIEGVQKRSTNQEESLDTRSHTIL